jgi:hypothetical protein
VTAIKVLMVLVAIWIAIGIIGLIVKGLFYLFVIALVAGGITLAVGSARGRLTRR